MAHALGWGRGSINGGDYGTREDQQQGILDPNPVAVPGMFEISAGGNGIRQNPAGLVVPLADYDGPNSRWRSTNGHLSVACFLHPLNTAPTATGLGFFGKASAANSTTKTEYSLGIDGTNNRYRFYVCPTSGACESAVGGGPQKTDREKLMIGVYNPSTIALYMDGHLVDSHATSNSGIKDQTAEALSFSNFTNGAAPDPDAIYNMVGVWNRELSQDEIGRLWADPFVMWRPRRSDFMMGPGTVGGGAATPQSFFLSF